MAVLIDAENISSLLFEPLREKVEAIGVPVVWQLHGDFFSWPHPGWQEGAQREGIELRHQFHSGKNAADIPTTIAAMDLLHAGKVRGFCIPSSNKDFTALARRPADRQPAACMASERTMRARATARRSPNSTC
ncbi:MAG: NYN domain-containing protein [Opitutus sp.]|nr:NYN domain-containing protein [Opitutus sp.]